MSTLFVLVGPPGIGKTSYCQRHMGERDVRISMDDLQQMMGGGVYGNYRKDIKKIYEAAEMSILQRALLDGHDVWLDRTNMSADKRQRYVLYAKTVTDSTVTCIDFTVLRPHFPTGRLLVRRMRDSRGVSEEQRAKVIKGMWEQYDKPLMKEGFTQIIDMKMEDVT